MKPQIILDFNPKDEIIYTVKVWITGKKGKGKLITVVIEMAVFSKGNEDLFISRCTRKSGFTEVKKIEAFYIRERK